MKSINIFFMICAVVAIFSNNAAPVYQTYADLEGHSVINARGDLPYRTYDNAPFAFERDQETIRTRTHDEKYGTPMPIVQTTYKKEAAVDPALGR